MPWLDRYTTVYNVTQFQNVANFYRPMQNKNVKHLKYALNIFRFYIIKSLEQKHYSKN